MADSFAQLRVAPDAEPRVRSRLTAEEFMVLSQSGELGEVCNVELVDGELVEMPPEGSAHGINAVRTVLTLARLLEDRRDLVVTSGTAVKLASTRVVGPDALVFHRPQGRPTTLSPDTVLLAVEHAYSTRSYDLNKKPRLYAEGGVAELWVLDNVENTLHRFHSPADGEYQRDPPRGLDEALALPFAPEISVRVGDLFDLD